MYSSIRSNALRDVRTRSTGVISPSRVRIGLILSAPPSHAWAAPIRPPRRRYSSVSTANQKRIARIAASVPATAASTSPPALARAAASASRPSAPALTVESTTSMRRPG